MVSMLRRSGGSAPPLYRPMGAGRLPGGCGSSKWCSSASEAGAPSAACSCTSSTCSCTPACCSRRWMLMFSVPASRPRQHEQRTAAADESRGRWRGRWRRVRRRREAAATRTDALDSPANRMPEPLQLAASCRCVRLLCGLLAQQLEVLLRHRGASWCQTSCTAAVLPLPRC